MLLFLWKWKPKMIGYEKSGKSMDKKGWCGDNFSDAVVPEKLFINFVWPKVNILVCISYCVNSNALTTPVRIYGEPYAHKFGAVDIFRNITRRQAILPIAKFHHVFLLWFSGWYWLFQMSLSQSESTFVYESIISSYVVYRSQ